jgi:long-chain acyl-CoA synthetase
MTTAIDSSAILASVESFCGSFFDLDRHLGIDASGFAKGRNDLAKLLGKKGLAAGHRVVMAVNNGPLFPAALAAILRHGATPLLVHGSTPLLGLIAYAGKIGARFILREPLPIFESDSSGLASAEVIVAGDESDGEFASVSWYQLKDNDGDFQPNSRISGVPLHPTSGTTGKSKIAVRPGYCCMEEARHYIETIEAGPDDHFLVCVPMSHAYGYGMGTMVPILANATIITQRQFNPRAALRALFEKEISIFPAAPAMLDLMLKTGDWPDFPPRHILVAGSPLPDRTAVECRDRIKTRVRPLYGTTETGGISIATLTDADQPGCVGPPMRDVEIKLKPVAGIESDASDVGLLHVRSSSMMSGYLCDDGNELESIPEGWFNTGDLARIDSSGSIHLIAREKEIINCSGLKVVPKEVEKVISSLDGVLEVAVYAGKHRSGSEIVKAAIVASKALNHSDVRRHCERYLVAYKRPEFVIFLSTLPRSSAGKILRDQLP